MTVMERSAPNVRALKMRVQGMDCSACAIKIENALKRLPGVSDINVNYGTETLALSVNEDRTSREMIEEKIRGLGYAPQSMAGAAALAAEPDSQLDRAWWQIRKGQVVIVSATLLAVAFVVASVAPSLSFWAYLAAAVIGLVWRDNLGENDAAIRMRSGSRTKK